LRSEGYDYAVVLFDYVARDGLTEKVWAYGFACVSDYVEDFPVAQVPIWNDKVIPEYALAGRQPELTDGHTISLLSLFEKQRY
jgi:hypothetical protein